MTSSIQKAFRTTVWLAVTLVVVIAIDVLFFVSRSWNAEMRAGEHDAQLVAVRLGDLLERYRDVVKTSVAAYGGWRQRILAEGRKPTPELLRGYLEERTRIIGQSMDVAVLNFRIGYHGSCVCGVGKPGSNCPSPESSEWFRQAVAHPGKTLVISPSRSTHTGERSVVTICRLMEDDQAVFAIDVATEVFQDILDGSSPVCCEGACVVDSDGCVVLHDGEPWNGESRILGRIGTLCAEEGSRRYAFEAGRIVFWECVGDVWHVALVDHVSHVWLRVGWDCLSRLLAVFVVFALLAGQYRWSVRRIRSACDTVSETERAVSFIAGLLKDVMSLPFDQNALDPLLRWIGEYLGVDRCYVYKCRLYQERWVTDLVAEWCADGVPSAKEDLWHNGPPGLPEFCDTIDAGNDYVFRRTDDLPPQTRQWFEQRQVRSFYGTPITDMHGVSTGYLGLDFVQRPMKAFSPSEVHNIHEAANIVKLCLTRQKALEVLRGAEKSKSDFFASISHDIRTPLNSIIGFTQLLQSETDETVRSEYLQNIAFSGETLLALVNDVLDTFRLESGRMKFFRTMFDPSYLLRRVLATLAPSAEEKGVELKVDAADLPMLSLDEKRVRQLLFNLIGNAIKFTDDGTVSVNASFTPVDDKVGCVHFSVQDTGIGISPRDLDKVGRPYVRLDMDSTARGGTGLGLAICRRIIEQSGGTLDISSELGKGTTVTVELPGVKYSRTAPEDVHGRKTTRGDEMTVAPPDQTYDFSNLKVLVVDDLEMNRCVLVASCRRLGVGRVLEAKSGIEALDILGSQIANPPDIILTDMKMPGMDGCELIRRVRMVSALAEVPICLVTADVEARRYALESGAFDILLKPVLQSNLVAILSKIIPPPCF